MFCNISKSNFNIHGDVMRASLGDYIGGGPQSTTTLQSVHSRKEQWKNCQRDVKNVAQSYLHDLISTKIGRRSWSWSWSSWITSTNKLIVRVRESGEICFFYCYFFSIWVLLPGKMLFIRRNTRRIALAIRALSRLSANRAIKGHAEVTLLGTGIDGDERNWRTYITNV